MAPKTSAHITQATKRRVEDLVRTYVRTFPQEYEVAKHINRARAQNQRTSWGEVAGSSLRERYRIPETLWIALMRGLSTEQHAELDTEQGIRWFQRKFPEFVPNQKID